MGVRRGGAGRHRGPRFPPSPPPPAEARPGLGGGRAGLINQGLVVGAGGGDATQGGKLATEEAGAGLVLLPRSLTGPRLPPRRGTGAGGPSWCGAAVGPQQPGWARGAGRCPLWVAGARPGLFTSIAARELWVDGSSVPFPGGEPREGRPGTAPPSAGARPRPRPWALSGASSEPFTCQVPGKWKSPVLDVIGERRRACWRRKMRFP